MGLGKFSFWDLPCPGSVHSPAGEAVASRTRHTVNLGSLV